MNKKYHWYAGITAVIIYIVAVIVGGMFYPGYSHISQDISQLTSTNSPIRNGMNVFIIYNILLSFFGYGLYSLSVHKSAKIAAIFTIVIGILGIVITGFPINTRGTEITFTGQVHIVIVSIVSLLTVISGFLFWVGFKDTSYRLFAKISLISGMLFVITGPLAAVHVLSPYAGVYERIPIGIFLLWVLITSLTMLKEHSKQ